MAKFQPVPIVVDAVRLEKDYLHEDSSGIYVGRPGQWVVTRGNKSIEVYSDKKFREEFRPIEKAAWAEWQKEITDAFPSA